MMDEIQSAWFVPLGGRPASPTSIELFCLPFAGGNAMNFRAWPSHGRALQITGVEYPGRGSRFGEPPLHSVIDMSQQLAAAILARKPAHFALFGHSMGADIAFKTAQVLEAAGVVPLCVCLSARQAPHLPSRRKDIHHLPKNAFREELLRLGGTTPEVIASEELMALFEPLLRADFCLAEQRRLEDLGPIQAPILTLSGSTDPFLNEQDAVGWALYTSSSHAHESVNGDHFFMINRACEVVPVLEQALKRILDFKKWCPGEDLNLHALASTST